MPIGYACSCGQKIVLPTGTAGRRARCRGCGSVFTVPWPQEEAYPPQPLAYAPPPAAPGIGGEALQDQPPERFSADLAWSFLLPLVRGNWAIVVSLTLAVEIINWIPFARIWISPLLSAYLAALSLDTIAHAASGENDFPQVGLQNVWEDLLLPVVQFIGSWLIVLSPLIVLMMLDNLGGVAVPVWALYMAGAAGLLLWPATVLAIAIGGTINAARPDIVVRTAFAAPMAYLTVCTGVALAGAILILPDYYPLRSPIPGIPGAIVLGLAGTALGIYALLVVSRIVGLYYRHFKHRLPWTAE